MLAGTNIPVFFLTSHSDRESIFRLFFFAPYPYPPFLPSTLPISCWICGRGPGASPRSVTQTGERKRAAREGGGRGRGRARETIVPGDLSTSLTSHQRLALCCGRWCRGNKQRVRRSLQLQWLAERSRVSRRERACRICLGLEGFTSDILLAYLRVVSAKWWCGLQPPSSWEVVISSSVFVDSLIG